MGYGKNKIIMNDKGYVTREKSRERLVEVLKNVNRSCGELDEENDLLRQKLEMLRKGYQRLGKENEDLKRKLKNTEKERDQINEYYADLLSSQ